MPIFTVKKIVEGPDQKSLEQMVEIHLPNEVFTRILMMLDRRNLHTARQVCPEWNSMIKEQVLGTVEGRKNLMRTSLQIQWREATPARSEVTIGGLTDPWVQVMALTDKLAVIGSGKISVVNMRDGVEVPGLSFSFDVDRYFRTFITKNVILLVKSPRPMVDDEEEDEEEALIWNVNTKAEIFNKKFPGERVEFDRHNEQVMGGRNTRLEITGTTVTEIKQASLPGDGELWEFSHPFYLMRVSQLDYYLSATLWKLDGTEFTRVGDLEAIPFHSFPVFCPARDILVTSSFSHLSQGRLRLEVYSTLTGQLTKNRVLTVPPGHPLPGDIVVNSNQLVVLVRQSVGQADVILVYELDALLSQAADQSISPRMFEIGLPGFFTEKIALNNTSVSAGLKKKVGRLEYGALKFITLDFWNTGN